MTPGEITTYDAPAPEWLEVPALSPILLTELIGLGDVVSFKLPTSTYNHTTAKGRARRT